ncbi:MAG: UpxY family transcription antiterminator [Bacteroidia bacterium]
MSSQQWFALYTRPRFERRAAEMLSRQGIENWLPLHKVKKQWSDRVKWVEEPVFKSYIFVRISEREYFHTLNTYGVVRFVTFGGQAAAISESQMDFLRRLLDTGYELETVSLDLETGDQVEIVKGPLAGRRGVLISRAGSKKMRVDLEMLGKSIFITVPIENLLKIS